MGRRVLSKESKKKSASKRSELDAVAGRFAAFRPAAEVFSAVRAVPTVMLGFDRATRVGGFPVDRITLVHGPSNEGKTFFALLVALSFCLRGHPVLYVDAERTTPYPWVAQIFGGNEEALKLLYAIRPTDYEHAVETVRAFCKAVAAKREQDSDATGIVIIDSLRKLVPKGLMDLIMKEVKVETAPAIRKKVAGPRDEKKLKGVDGMGGRAGQIRAALNAAWMDELVPLLDSTGTAALLIARETDDADANPFDKKFGNDYKIGGGKAVVYDSSLAVRAERACFVYVGPDGAKKVVGEKHRLTIWKTKIGGKDGAKTVCYFHSSNGVETPLGHDRARDLFDLGKEFDVIKVSGGWYEYRGIRINGEPRFLDKLRTERDFADWLDDDLRARFDEVPAHDGDGVVE